MYVAGIVAEFDPFHKGHEYLLRRTRELGATHIVVAMSGDVVQRGETAVCPKHERAEMAVRHGADLVIELPAPYSCSMAAFFADAAIRLLGRVGIDALAFGSETDSADLIRMAASAVDELSDSEEVRRLTTKGMTYPAALHAAAAERFGGKAAAVIASPNSTLAVEYVRALVRNGISAEILPVRREGAAHDSTEGASGSNLRRLLAAGEDIAGFVPEGCVPRELSEPSGADDILLYGLLTADRDTLLRLPEVNEPLADRIIKARRDPKPTLGEFLQDVKSANFTLARIRRSALHLALGVTREDFIEPPYVRVLAFNDRGAEVLRRVEGVPKSVSLRELEGSSEEAAKIIAIENRAVRLQQMCRKKRNFDNEYTRKITKTPTTEA